MTYQTRTLLKASVGLALVSGLGVFAYFGIHVEKKQAERRKAVAKLALDFDKDQVVRIELEAAGEHAVVVRTSTDEYSLPAWKMVEPVRVDGESVGINALLGTLERMDAERRLAMSGKDTLEVYGLSPPRARWTLTFKGGETLGLLVGKKSPFDNHLYLKRDGADEVMLVDGFLDGSLCKKPFALRGKRLLSLEPSRVRGLVIETRSLEGHATIERIELQRQQKTWHLAAPIQDQADPDEVAGVLATLRNMQARAFPAAGSPDKSYGLDPPAVEVTIQSGPGRVPRKLRLGWGTLPANKGQVFARLVEPEGPVAEILSYQLRAVQRTLFDLQAKSPLRFDREKVSRIKLASDRELIVLERTVRLAESADGKTASGTESWSLVSPKAVPARRYKVKSLLTGLHDLKAKRFVGRKDDDPLGAFGLDRPARTIALYDENGKDLGTLRIGKADDQGTYVLGSAREQICQVDTAKLDHLPDSVDDLREGAPPMDLAPGPKKP